MLTEAARLARGLRLSGAWASALFLLGVLGCLFPTSAARAGPIFIPMPGVAPHPGGFTVHSGATGPQVLLPGGALGPYNYGDPLNSLDLHHWEVEFNNPDPVNAVNFDILLFMPGLVLNRNLNLPAGGFASVYLDMHYLDNPPEVDNVGNWAISFSAPANLSSAFTIDTSVMEYSTQVAFATGFNVTLAGGATFGNAVGGSTTVVMGNLLVPEPSTALLLASGLVAMAVGQRRKVQ